MKFRQGILLLALALVTVMTAGCICCCNTANSNTDNPWTGTATTTATAKPVVNPGSATTATPVDSTAAPTLKPDSGSPRGDYNPTTYGAIFDLDNFKSFEYRATHSGTADKTTLSTTNLGETTYNGQKARHVLWVSTQVAGGREYKTTIDYYFGVQDRKMLGGHMKVEMQGQVIMEQDMTPVTLEHVENPTATGPSDAPLTALGPEKVTIDGKTYDCIKYSVTREGKGTSYYWITPSVPVPVKFEMSDDEGTYTSELVSWS